MRTGRPKAALVLTDEERQLLQSCAHRSRTVPQLARRVRIVLECATGADNKTVARKLRVQSSTVGKWRSRFVRDRIEGIHDEPRPGTTPRKVTDEQVERVVVQTLESTPKGQTHWSVRGMAKATGLSRMTTGRRS